MLKQVTLVKCWISWKIRRAIHLMTASRNCLWLMLWKWLMKPHQTSRKPNKRKIKKLKNLQPKKKNPSLLLKMRKTSNWVQTSASAPSRLLVQSIPSIKLSFKSMNILKRSVATIWWWRAERCNPLRRRWRPKSCLMKLARFCTRVTNKPKKLPKRRAQPLRSHWPVSLRSQLLWRAWLRNL